jgi:hypothetical protein
VDTVDVQQVLVVSRLVGDVGARTLRRLVQLARRLSQRHGVCGAMLFDGETAVHLVEGEAAALADFIGAVHGDDPPRGLHIVARRSGAPLLASPRWCVGYVEPLALDGWCESPGSPVDAGDAFAHFMTLLASGDCG